MAVQDYISHDNSPRAVLWNDEKAVSDPTSEGESTPNGSITARTADWTAEEESYLVRKCVYIPRFKRSDL